VPTPVNILLVDDKPENLFALEELLGDRGYTLYSASSGNDALRLLLKHDFAVVLLDVEMPGMDGYETAQLMRSAERTRPIPIIFVTAGDRSEERAFRGYEAGAVDFLYKPIHAHTLRSKVGVFVELYRTTAELRERVADLEYVHQTLSHDLRAPLRSIQGFAEILAEDFPETAPKGAKDALARLRRAAGSMSSMIDDLYALLRTSATPVELADIELATVVGDTLETLRGELEATGARVTTGELPVVHTNRRLLGQVLQNLIQNSLKFRSEAPPVIELSVATTAEHWHVTVRDNGVGISADDRDRVFRLFTRLGATPGTGVGLTLCKRAIERLGGHIWIGTEPGPGTAVHFTLPRPA
jgi:signal transduction histidine kinase